MFYSVVLENLIMVEVSNIIKPVHTT